MANEDVELGGARERAESIDDANATTSPLYMAVIVFLGVVLIIGVVGWIALVWVDKTLPDGLGVVIGTVAGGLVGLVSNKSGK